jgi:hypothetical protein
VGPSKNYRKKLLSTKFDPKYGPFENTEISIYCDESRHAGQSHQQFMVIGGLWFPRTNRQENLIGLRAIQHRYQITGELKWGKVSRSKLDGYKAIVDFISDREDIHFHCLVVDKSQAENDKQFQNDKQFGFWVFYLHCLKQWMGNSNRYYVSIDFKPESLHSGPTRLRRALEQECVGCCWLKSLGCVDSRENLFCQVGDVLIGAVGYEQNSLNSSPAKSALARHIAAKFKRDDLKNYDDVTAHRFNVCKVWA